MDQCLFIDGALSVRNGAASDRDTQMTKTNATAAKNRPLNFTVIAIFDNCLQGGICLG